MAYYYSPFRKSYGMKESGKEEVCPFCADFIQEQSVKDLQGRIIENDYYRWIVNFYPRFEGHTMLIPKRHVTKLSGESAEELYARQHLMAYAVDILARLYGSTGIEVYLQTGQGSMSTIPHLHWHLFPASPDDPLRGFEKLGHFTTTEEGKEKVVIFPIEIQHAKEGLQAALAPIVTEFPYEKS